MSLIHKFIQGGQRFVIDVNSGSVHEIDDLIYDILDSEYGRPDIEETKSRLGKQYSEGEITEAFEDIQELIDDNLLYSKDTFEEEALTGNSESLIKAVCLNIVHDCNLRCKYCFADQGEYKGRRQIMSAETGKKAIDFLLENSGYVRNIEVDFFGGEPMMAYAAIKEIVEYGKEAEKKFNKNIRFAITTNAVLLDDENIEYLNNNMKSIVLSVDGRKEVNDKIRVTNVGTGSYDIIMPKIKKMVDRRDKSKQYYVRGTFTHENTDFYEDVIALANEGFREISIEPVVLDDENTLAITKEDIPAIFESYDRLYEEMLSRLNSDNEFNFYHFNIDLNGGPCLYKRISGCGAGHEYAAITPEGDIYPCHQFVGNDSFKLGNIYEGKFDNALSKEFADAHLYNKPACRECWARFYCSGGCQANNYNFNKDIHIPYEIGCELTKKRVECAVALKANSMMR